MSSWAIVSAPVPGATALTRPCPVKIPTSPPALRRGSSPSRAPLSPCHRPQQSHPGLPCPILAEFVIGRNVGQSPTRWLRPFKRPDTVRAAPDGAPRRRRPSRTGSTATQWPRTPTEDMKILANRNWHTDRPTMTARPRIRTTALRPDDPGQRRPANPGGRPARRFHCHVSRRILLRSVAGSLAVPAIAPHAGNARAAPEKRSSQRAAAYQPTPEGLRRCELCTFFLPPDDCVTVVGPVARQGWCKTYMGP